MRALMIHVEQIVRPVRAFAPRKLRMRQELLAHLLAAVDEEHTTDANEAAALERAKVRIGEPGGLTRALQQSVPWAERTLMGRLPVPSAVERWEVRSMRWRKDCPLTLMQSSVLIAGTMIFPFLGCLSAALGSHFNRLAVQRLMFDHPITWAVLNLGYLLLTFASFAVSGRLIVAVASGSLPFRSPRNVGFAAGIVGLPALSILLLLACANGRPPGGQELLRCLLIGLAVLVSQILVGRLIATMRRPYAEWLTLDVAG